MLSVVMITKKFNVKKIAPDIITDTKIHVTGMEQSIIMITMMWKRIEKFSKQKKRITRKGLPFSWVLCDLLICLISCKNMTYTNADLKICQYLRLYMKMICWTFHIKISFTFWDTCTWDTWKVSLQTFRNIRIC